MSTAKSQSAAAVIQRLRRLWCVRINGLNTYNSMSPENEIGYVPSAGNMPKHWLGHWGTDEGYTFICLETGDLFVIDGEPNNELLDLLKEVCPNGSELRVPYFHEESLWVREVLARVKDPYSCSSAY